MNGHRLARQCTIYMPLSAGARLRRQLFRQAAIARAAPRQGIGEAKREPFQPAHAIIAPLSVHKSGGGETRVAPTSNASRLSTLRIAWFAATPPAATSALGVPNGCGKGQSGAEPVKYDVNDCLLKARTEISNVLVGQRCDLLRFQS